MLVTLGGKGVKMFAHVKLKYLPLLSTGFNKQLEEK